MRVNHYLCDCCGKQFDYGYKVQVTFPPKESDKKYGSSIQKTYRDKKTLDLCEECVKERLNEAL